MSRVTIPQAIKMGIAEHQAGRLAQAESIYRQVIAQDSKNADALHLLGVLAHQCGHNKDAVDLMRRSVAINPKNASAYTNLGEALRVLERYPEAIEAIEQALKINPNSAEAIGNLGLVHAGLGRTDRAEELYRKALTLNPKSPQTHNNLGNILLARGDQKGALAEYDLGLTADPNFADGHNNRGSALESMDRLDEAMAEYMRAVELRPNFAVACNNAGNVARRLCKWSEAMRWCQRSLQLDPKFSPARWNVGLIELTMGDYPNGWPKYELRFVATTQRLPEGLVGPRWDGSPLAGKTILLYAEQGLGDGFQAARYIPMVAARGGKIVIECHKSQSGLLRKLEGVVDVISTGDLRPPYDVFTPMMSLPLLFGTTVETIPRQFPYLWPDESRVGAWREWMSVFAGVKVGLVWNGSTTPEPLRSISLDELAPLARIAGVRYFNLQFGKAAAEANDSAAWLHLVDLSTEVADFGEMAACMMNLDLILTIDTGAAHLAGALGRPVWTLIPHSPDWRWFLDREDSPWYPTMRLFRQTRRKVWTDVVEKVAIALDDFRASNLGH